MAVDRRKKDLNWQIVDAFDHAYSGNYQHAQLAVLMDLRDELKRLNDLLHCSNFVGIPATLRSIRRNMPVRRPKVKK